MRIREALLLTLTTGLMMAQAPKVDPAVPAYTKEAEFPQMRVVGSDTLATVLAYWSEGFSKHHPNVKVPLETKGSATAPPALTDGLAHLGPMSREMTADEIGRFEKKKGYKPTPIVVALDAIVVLVNKENPLPKLTMPELDAVYSHTRKGGHPTEVTSWGQLGLKGEFEKAPITLFGRNSLSGTHAFFKEHALFKGNFKPGVKEEEEAMTAVWSVASDKFAMCYVGLGNATGEGIRTVPLSAKPGDPAVEGTFSNVISGKYPLGRKLFIYIDKAPGKKLAPLVREYLRFVLSQEGQQVVLNNGFLPLTAEMVRQELVKLD